MPASRHWPRQVPERPPSQETKAALIGVPTLSSLFCGRRLPYDQRSLFRSKRITCGWRNERPPKDATCIVPAHAAPRAHCSGRLPSKMRKRPLRGFAQPNSKPLDILLTVRHGACSSHRCKAEEKRTGSTLSLDQVRGGHDGGEVIDQALEASVADKDPRRARPRRCRSRFAGK